MAGTNVFTYGSLMYPEVIYNLVQKKDYVSMEATLREHTRRQVKAKVYPGLIPCPGTHIVGILYLDVTPEDLSILHDF